MTTRSWTITRTRIHTRTPTLEHRYSRFYSIFFIGLVLFYEYWAISDVLVLLLHSFWIPQIVYNYKQNSAKALDISYIVIITMTRMFIPLYVWLCPHNVARYVSAGWIGMPDTTMGVLFLFHILSQMIVLLMQRKYGAAFFVPKFLRSPRYDYYRRVPDEVAVRGISNDSNVVAHAVEQNIIVVDCENDDDDDEEESDDDDVSSKLVSTSRQGVYCTCIFERIVLSLFPYATTIKSTTTLTCI